MKTILSSLLLTLGLLSASVYSQQILTNYWLIPWDTTKVTNGLHTIYSIAWDAAGNCTTSAPVQVYVLNELYPPTVKLITPTYKATVKGKFLIQAEVSDDVGVVRSDLMIDNKIAASSTNTPTVTWIWNAAKLKRGWHTLEVRAWDASGKSSPYAAIPINR